MLDKNESINRANRLIEKAIRGSAIRPIDGLMYRNDIGQIDLEIGKKGEGSAKSHGSGLSKLLQKHPEELKKFAETLARGELLKTTVGSKIDTPYDDSRRAIAFKNMVIYIHNKGKRRWKIGTNFASNDEVRKAYEIDKRIRSSEQTRKSLQEAAT